MVDASEISGNRASVWNIEAGFEGTEKGNNARPMVDLSGRQYGTTSLTTQI